MRIFVDPGHGGSDVGAVGPTAYTEAEAVLRISKHLTRGLIEAGHDTAVSRESDLFVSLSSRAGSANAWNADLFLSIHANAFSNEAAHGYEVWTSVGQTKADPIAERIFESIGGAFPKLAPRFDKTDGDSDKEAGFVVLRQTKMAAVLIETAFISNAIEEQWLRETGWRMRMAGAIVSAVGRPQEG